MMNPIAVIGGGIAGIQAALELASSGYEIYLIEKEEKLGGVVEKLDKVFPTFDCASCVLFPKLKKIEKNEKIKVYTNSEVIEVKKSNENFEILLKDGRRILASKVIVATGFKLLDGKALERYGYKKYENVLTSLEYEALLKEKSIKPKKVAFILCVGSRNEKFKNYCSKICCLYATKQAILTKEKFGAEVTIFYMDKRGYSKEHDDIFSKAEEFGVKYVRAMPGGVEKKGSYLLLAYEDMKNNRVIEEEFDIVVLAPAIVPTSIKGLEKDEFGFLKEANGIYPIGCCSSPCDIPMAIAEAKAVAAKLKPLSFSFREREKGNFKISIVPKALVIGKPNSDIPNKIAEIIRDRGYEVFITDEKPENIAGSIGSFTVSFGEKKVEVGAIAIIEEFEEPEIKIDTKAKSTVLILHDKSNHVEALKKALKIKGEVYILYKNLRTCGKDENYYSLARKKGIKFIRYEDGPSIKDNVIKVKDVLTNEEIEIKAENIITFEPIAPSKENKKISKVLKIPLDKEGFFLEKHAILRPFELRDGIFVVPVSPVEETKKMQALAIAFEMLKILEKKEINKIVAIVDEEKCCGCGNCEAICAFGAAKVRSDTSKIDPYLCQGCGICASFCPAKAISLPVEPKLDLRSKTIIFACENCPSLAIEQSKENENDQIIKVKCSGMVNEALIYQAFLNGAEKVLVLGCKDGDCRYVIGNFLAKKVVENVENSLRNAKINKEVKFEQLAGSEIEKCRKLVRW